jgi:hypothetical protein
LIGFAVVMLGASLLIMIATQMISALFSHRGANLKWGLETMFKHVATGPAAQLAIQAGTIAQDVLTHGLISDSIFSGSSWLANRIKLATAIHPDELVAILKDLASKKYAGTPLAAEITALVDAPNAVANRRIELLTGAAGLPAALGLAGVGPVIESAVDNIRDSAGKLDAWFAATMCRVSQRFTTYMRIWTIAFACAFALITGLNSVTLLSDLYTRGDFRQQMVGSATQIKDLADKVLQDSKVAPADPTSAVLEQRAKEAAAVREILTKSSFDVLQFQWKPSEPMRSQLPGVLATAALLSLGAPFWFNLLKSLTNLRPSLAAKQDPAPKGS